MSPRLGTQLNRLVVEELQLGAEPVRVLEVVADLGIARTALGEPVRQADVELAPAQLRQEAVGGVLEERMTEPGAARRRALGELPLAEAVQLGLDRPADHRLDSVDGEVPADHGRDADDLLLGLGERLEAGREEDLERTRQAGGRHLVADEGRQVLGEQRIALGRVDDLPGLLVAEAGARVREQAPCLRVVEALQRDRHGVGPRPPTRPPVRELGPGGAHDQERSPAAVAEKLLDDVEEEAARPVHVLEHDDHGLRRGEHPDEA